MPRRRPGQQRGARSPPPAARAVSRWVENRTGWSIRNFVRTARRYRTIEIQAGSRVIIAADPLPRDLHEALDRTHEDPRRANRANSGTASWYQSGGLLLTGGEPADG